VSVCANCGHENPAEAAFCNACGAQLAAPEPAEEQRKTVTVLFADVTGSTALGERLDPESLRRVLARYFDVAREAVGRHGGVVEKFIGDAVMAVFGVPRVHEDDALRAVRAALELRRTLEPLNEELERDYGTTLELRIGVNTGEVVTGTEERLATGDAVNVAARLEQVARPGEILLGPETVRLVRDAVTVEVLEPLELKGKSEPFAPARLIALDADAPGHARRLHVQMVGRERQLSLLRNAYENVVSERSCHLFTVLGSAGVGKSRLVAEFLRTLDDATVLAGRCLSYGEGITYWPVVEIVKQAGGPERLEDPAARAALGALLDDTGGAATPAQIAWAFRRLLETTAAQGPLVCLVDDIQWGEDTFLDLVEHVADLSRDASILFLCMARPELLDRRPTWAGGKLNATSVLLEPLSEAETDELITRLEGTTLDDSLQARIRRAAGGNPLFVEEMLALVSEAGGDGEVTVPPTIQALLAARLDQLDSRERHVLEHASIEGEVFHRGGVAALSREESQVDTRLTALVRKDLLRPWRAQLAGEDGYRFRHLLIRDAAYTALSKATRAELHERFAVWLDERGADLIEIDEIVGYHLEQAFRYRDELGPISDDDRRVRRRAGELLARAGRRAFDRGDRIAAANLLQRAIGLLADLDELRVHTLIDYGRCLLEAFDDLAEARRALDQATEEAAAFGRQDLLIRAQLEAAYLGMVTEKDIQVDAMEALGRKAIDVLDHEQDAEGVARAWFIVAMSLWSRARWDDMAEPLMRSIEYARRAGRRSMEDESLRFVLTTIMFGSTPTAAGAERGREILEATRENRELQAWAIRVIGTMLAMEGRLEEARPLFEESRAIFTELGNKQGLAVLAFSTAPMELRAGNAEAAEQELRAALDLVYAMGDRARLPNLAALLADALIDQGRLDEAAEQVEVSREAVQAGDATGEASWRMASARVLARRGSLDEAVTLADEAIGIMDATNELLNRPSFHMQHAEVLALAGRDDKAEAELRRAIEVAAVKGATAEIRHAEALLEALAAPR